MAIGWSQYLIFFPMRTLNFLHCQISVLREPINVTAASVLLRLHYYLGTIFIIGRNNPSTPSYQWNTSISPHLHVTDLYGALVVKQKKK